MTGFRPLFSAKKKLGLYVHVPFCLSKCAYCDFYSVRRPSEESTAAYVDALICHMKRYRDACRDYLIDTVFFGGGTPTSLPEKDLMRLIGALRRLFRLDPNAEFTIEANPATVTLPLLKKLRRSGVNRISFGLQSGVPEELRTLGRVHTLEGFEESFRAARQAGFDNISVDLMFGFPGQTMESLHRSLSYLTSFQPEHISLYNLRVEPGTLFGRMASEGKLRLPEEDLQADMYLAAVRYLRSKGYLQYEISNFARKGKECRHNLKYWNCEEYLGFGPAAHSFFNTYRFSAYPDVKRYIRAVTDLTGDVELLDSNRQIVGRECIGEYVMLRMRLNAGIDKREFSRRFGRSFDEMYGGRLEKYVRAGYARQDRDRVALTPRGFLVSNAILSDILDYEDLGSLSISGI